MHRFASCAPAALVGALALLLLAPAGAAAQTTIPGGNIVNQTWTAADSPYVVQGDITVPAGAFLVLQAGTVVRFATSDAAASGADTSRPELIVLGTLTASGTAASPVTLESSGSSTTSWYGVRAMSGSMVSLTYTTLVEAANGLAVEGGNPSMTDSVLRGNRYGLYVASGSPTLTRTVLTQNATAVRAVGPGTTSIVGCTLAYNTGTAIESLGGSTTVIDSIITNTIYQLLDRQQMLPSFEQELI